MANIVTVTPASVRLKAAETQRFTVSVSWSIDPAGVGTIDGTGLYKAPESIADKRDVHAVAKDTDDKEIGRATITLLPPVTAPVPSSTGTTTPSVTAPVPPSAGATAMIQPTSATLRAGETKQFRVSVFWALDPATAPGKIDEVSGEYSVPCEVLASKTFFVVARNPNARNEEWGRSTVTVAPPDPPKRTLTVTPETAVLLEGQQLALRVEPKDQAVNWQIPARGTVDSAGVYTAPEKIVSQQTVILTAMSPDGAHYGNATVTLSEASLCIRRLAVIWLLVSIVLLSSIVYLWPKLSSPSQDISVLVSPPMATLSLQSKQQQQFTAEVTGVTEESKKAVTWTASGGGAFSSSGVFTPSAGTVPPAPIQVTATSKEDRRKLGAATVYLTKDASMVVQPYSAILQPSQIVQFSISGMPPSTPVEWSLSRKNLGEIDAGKYTAPPSIDRTEILSVLATATIGKEKVRVQAAANITLLGPQPRVSERFVIAFVIVMGALGSILHSIMSFTAYVGTREFVTSWSWWYYFKPFVGGMLALFFFFLIGLGKVGWATMSPMSLALICGLVGLFSDKATRKLAEIFDTILGTKEDTRGDKLTGQASKTQDAAVAVKGPAPAISALNPSSTKVGATTPLLVTITGTNFREEATVLVKSASRKPKNVSPPTSLQVELTKEDIATAGEVEIVVINADATQSNAMKLKVD